MGRRACLEPRNKKPFFFFYSDMPVNNHHHQPPRTAPLREAGHTDQFFALSTTLHQPLSKFDIRLDPTSRTFPSLRLPATSA